MTSNKEIIEWKWTYGPMYEKSARNIQKIGIKEDTISNTAIQQSLLSENDEWSLLEQQVFISTNMNTNKREDTYNRMAEREMVGQIGMNPFFNRDYLADVIVQDNFLKPICTNVEKQDPS
jgi:hypothetical protein